MFTNKFFKRSTLLMAVVGVFCSLLGNVGAVSAADIGACANKRTGVMRVSKVCKKTEFSIVLRQEGLGTVGPTGDRGPATLVLLVRLGIRARLVRPAQLVNMRLLHWQMQPRRLLQRS